MERFETQYPVTAREKEIKKILGFVLRGQSCQLISIPGAGRSTVLRLLAYHQKLREYHLSNVILRPKAEESRRGSFARQGRAQDNVPSKSFLFVYVNFAEISSFETSELNKSLFLAILSSIENFHPRGVHSNTSGVLRSDSPEVNLYKEVSLLFKEAITLSDSQVLFQNLKKAIEQLRQVPVFLFDRFSEFADKIGPEFYSNLRVLRTASGGKLAVVFSTHRPLENLLPVEKWRDFYEFFVGNHVFLDLYDKIATDFRLLVLEKEYNKTLPSKIKKELVRLTGGHGKLMKLSTQIILDESSPPRSPSRTPRGWPNGLPRGGELADFLLSHILIQGSLLEIWQSLAPEERERQAEMFPLFEEFVKRRLAESLVPKTIRLDEKTREIYFGDEPISGLTASEFRLLKHLIQNPNRVCDREEIIQAVWTESKTHAGVTDEALDQMTYRLRKKIEDEADNPKHLLTVKGRGFRFIP